MARDGPHPAQGGADDLLNEGLDAAILAQAILARGFVSRVCLWSPFRLSLPLSRFWFFIVVLFLGGGFRYRAPWFDGANEGPCFSVITGVQQQCVTRGHCSAATAKSSTVRSAGLPAECQWIGDGPSAPHTSHDCPRSFGSSCRRLCMGDSEGPSTPHTSYEFNCPNGSSCRRLCLENQESQIWACERHLRQSYHPGWMVGSRCSFIRGIRAGRGRRGDARVALGKWTCYPHDKADRSWVGRDRIRSQNISGPVNNVEALLGAAGRRSCHIQVFCAKRRSCGGRHFPCFTRESTGIPMRGRQPRPDRSQQPHTGSRSLERSLWTSYHPDPEGSMVSKWWPGFRKTTSRSFFAEAGSSVSSLAPSLSKATPACTRMSHSQSNSTSRRL